MKRIKEKFLFLLVVIPLFLLFLPSNSFQKVSSGIPFLLKDRNMFAEEDSLIISLKPLSEKEQKQYLKANIASLGYKPIALSLENHSCDPYLIKADSLSLPIVSSDTIASSLQRSSLPASIGLKVAGFLFWPFSIPSTMHSIKTLQSYQKMKTELSIKSVKEELIPPYSTVNRVFFIEKDRKLGEFSLSVRNEETLEPKIFYISKLSEKGSAKKFYPLDLPKENYYLTYEGEEK